jgi:hypothetical protein
VLLYEVRFGLYLSCCWLIHGSTCAFAHLRGVGGGSYKGRVLIYTSVHGVHVSSGVRLSIVHLGGDFVASSLPSGSWSLLAAPSSMLGHLLRLGSSSCFM